MFSVDSVAFSPVVPVKPVEHFAITAIKKNVLRLQEGTKVLYSNYMLSRTLKQKIKDSGVESLTYEEFKFLENTKDDLSKLFRVAITLPFSPEFFFYSYLVFPCFAPNNPWAWAALPSSYQFPEEIEKKKEILEKRRIQGLINGISALKQKDVDSFSNKNEISNKINEILNINSMKEQLNSLKFLYSNSITNEKTKKLPKYLTTRLLDKNIPWTIIRSFCQSIGVEGVPNIFVVRRYNLVEVSKYIEKLKESDNYISQISLNNLSQKELQDACFDRFVYYLNFLIFYLFFNVFVCFVFIEELESIKRMLIN